jgi:hypothetical protein
MTAVFEPSTFAMVLRYCRKSLLSLVKASDFFQPALQEKFHVSIQWCFAANITTKWGKYNSYAKTDSGRDEVFADSLSRMSVAYCLSLMRIRVVPSTVKELIGPFHQIPCQILLSL